MNGQVLSSLQGQLYSTSLVRRLRSKACHERS
jgi:hypothetical protein